jgi:hypothetical protein
MDPIAIKKKQQALLVELSDICIELNWVIGIPKEAMTDGLICGTLEYVESSCLKVYGKDGYEIIDERAAKAKVANEQLATSDNIDDFKVVELTEEEFKNFIENGELPENVKLIGEPDDGIIYH